MALADRPPRPNARVYASADVAMVAAASSTGKDGSKETSPQLTPPIAVTMFSPLGIGQDAPGSSSCARPGAGDTSSTTAPIRHTTIENGFIRLLEFPLTVPSPRVGKGSRQNTTGAVAAPKCNRRLSGRVRMLAPAGGCVSLTPRDLTPVYKETIGKGAGARRWQRPVYVDHLPPCNQACPAGENIQAWLALAQAGDYERAWRKYMEENPLPGTHGRACYHPCESACNRQFLDQPVAIHSLDRFLGDLANEKGWTIAAGQPTGKRVLVVGAGPAGLSCAYHLRRFGHEVEIRDANPEPGGMMHYGIPAYRLPREGLEQEIARIEAMGVKILRNSRVNDVLAEKAAGAFDAVFLGIGAQVANHLDIPAMDGGKIIDAVTLMERVEKGRAPALGRVVGIVGGGNTAMDAARIAKRLGAEEAVLIFRYDKAQMEAHPYEAMEAFAEGVKIKWLSTVKQFGEDEIVVEQMEMLPDGSGLRRHRAVPDAQDRFAGAGGRTACRRRVPEQSARPPHRPGQGRRGGRPHAGGPRHLRRRRHDRRCPDHDRGGRPRQEGGAQHRCLAAWRGLREAAAASADPVRVAQPDRVPRCRTARAGRTAGSQADGL